MKKTSILIAICLLGGGFAVQAQKAESKKQASVIAKGAISYIASRGCYAPKDVSIEWPAAIFDPDDYRAPPSWGKKRIGLCPPWRGLLVDALGAGVFWSQADREAIKADLRNTFLNRKKTHEAFFKMFGWKLPVLGMLKNDEFPVYQVKQLKKVFNRIYLKPTDMIGTMKAQEVYDYFFKSYVADFARDVVLVKSKVRKKKMKKLLRDYKAAAKDAGANFNGSAYLRKVVTELWPEDKSRAYRMSKILGTILRRKADRTWPTVVRLLKKVIRDYDPALSKELRRKL
jgi:hypothetical protein